MSLQDPKFIYTNSVDTAKTNYLKEKWDRLYPGWNEKPKKEDEQSCKDGDEQPQPNR